MLFTNTVSRYMIEEGSYMQFEEANCTKFGIISYIFMKDFQGVEVDPV